MSMMLTKRRLSVAACALMLLSLTGCFTLDPKSGAGNGFAYITDVRSARQGDTDRVVIEFAANKLPDWDVRIDAPPFIQDGSGKTIKVAGHAALAVRLTNADAHTFYNKPARLNPPGTPNVTEVVRTDDFERYVTHIIGLENARRFDVTVLKAPSRLVIDIQH